jgi:acyl-CoA thioesterase YciA
MKRSRKDRSISSQISNDYSCRTKLQQWKVQGFTSLITEPIYNPIIFFIQQKAMTNDQPRPLGEPILRTLAMPADTNPHGDIFGGWIMAQMDIAGGIIAKEIAESRVVTVAVDTMKFLKPVRVGDVVCCYGKVLKIGTTSITINLEIWVKPVQGLKKELAKINKVTEAAFTYVSVDEEGNKQPILKRL